MFYCPLFVVCINTYILNSVRAKRYTITRKVLSHKFMYDYNPLLVGHNCRYYSTLKTLNECSVDNFEKDLVGSSQNKI